MILVDTSVWIDAFRGVERASVAAVLAVEESGEDAAIPIWCAQEILQGARDAREWIVLRNFVENRTVLSPQSPVEFHVRAARIFYDARKQGITLRGTTDCCIAQLALDHKCPLAHHDPDFEMIKRVRKSLVFL